MVHWGGRGEGAAVEQRYTGAMTEVIFGVRVRTHKDEKDGVMLYNCLDVLRGIGSAERPSRVIRGLKLERDCVRLPKMGWWLTFHGVVRLMLKWDSRAKRVMMDVLWTMRHVRASFPNTSSATHKRRDI